MLALCLRTTSVSSNAVHGLTRCCEAILPIPSGLLQSNNITLALPTDLHDILATAKTVLAIEGESTDVEYAHGQLALSSLQSRGPSHRSSNSPRFSTSPLFTSSFQPSNILPGLVLAFLPTCRVQHSRPATSPSILSLRLLTHVESPSIFTLHTTFGAHAFRDGAPSLPQAREAAGNLIHDYWGAIRVKRDHASVPRTKEVHRRGQRPTDIQGTGTLLWSDREGIRQVRYI